MALDLNQSTGQTFGIAGANHAPGLVPDPGSTPHSPAQLLGDDGAFHTANSTINPFPIAFQFIISGGGGTITSGNKGWLHIDESFTITNWLVLADQSGSVVVDILRANAAFPSVSIVGSGNFPTLTSAQFAQAAPSGWTSTALVTGDWIAFNVTGSPSSVQQITVCLSGNRTSF